MTRPVASIEKTATNPDVQGHLRELVKKLQKRTGELVVAGLMTLANWISSPAMAQETPRVVWAGQESTRILQAWETPKKVIVTPGGQHTDQWPKYTVTTSVSTSASAAVDKGGWQRVTLKDGRVMSFGDIEKLSKEEKAEVLGWLKRSEKSAYYEYELQAANQRIDSKKWVEKAANQRIDSKKWVEKAANQEWKELDKQLIGKYEQYISNIEKWAKGEKKLIEEIIASDITPEQLKTRAIALLNKKWIVLAGI
jgi:hypothetical protein